MKLVRWVDLGIYFAIIFLVQQKIYLIKLIYKDNELFFWKYHKNNFIGTWKERILLCTLITSIIRKSCHVPVRYHQSKEAL